MKARPQGSTTTLIGYLSIGLGLLLAVGPNRSAKADRYHQPFVLPIRGPYYIESDLHGEARLCQPGLVITPVKRYAVWGDIIAGTTNGAYFILDAAGRADPLRPPLTTFPSRGLWEEGLASLGVPSDIPLLDPHEVADGRPPQELRPWKYRYMRGLFGISDEGWSVLIALPCVPICFCTGILIMSRWVRRAVAGSTGLGAALAGEILVGGRSGPGVVVFFWPLAGMAAAGAGHWCRCQVRALVRWKRGSDR